MSTELLHKILDKLSAVEIRMEARFESMDARLESMDARLESMDARLNRIEQKLDATFEQTVHNTELLSTFSQLAATVEDNTTDIKLLKKLIAG